MRCPGADIPAPLPSPAALHTPPLGSRLQRFRPSNQPRAPPVGVCGPAGAHRAGRGLSCLRAASPRTCPSTWALRLSRSGAAHYVPPI